MEPGDGAPPELASRLRPGAGTIEIARRLEAAGGRGLIVGGYVRDALLGLPTKDIDFEVYGLPLAELEAALESLGEVIAVGRAFGVLRVKGLDVDFSIPRRDSRVGRGHRGFVVDLDPALDFREASRRRDLTINSMGYDPLTGEVLDPHGGRADLERRVLRATDAQAFSEDSLRALRVAQFRARFELEPDEELRRLCAAIDLSDLPGERIYEELRKLLLKGQRPSLGFAFLEETRLLRFFPELHAMVGVPQDREWHPEGTVWEHTLLVLDEAARSRVGDADEDVTILLGALLHDVGKPGTTVIVEGRVRSPSHEEAGVGPAEAFLERLRAPHELIRRVAVLVRHHLAPATYVKSGASPKAYRRLARKLAEAGLTPQLLHRLAQADHFGRTTAEALARDFESGDRFLEQMATLVHPEEATTDIVMGRHLLERGYRPSPAFGEVLARCRDLQDETGWTDPDAILARVIELDGPLDGALGAPG